MRLKLHTDYALRILLYLSASSRDDWIQGAHVADTFQISKGHILKVIQRLAGLGYVKTKRGVGGGTRLANEPKQIRLGRLISELENEDVLACVGEEDSSCFLHSRCRLRSAIREAQDVFYKALDQYTLEDISVEPSILISQLPILKN
jgi:Rrf2 family nitric oxide-sensitive transcriptional repressor